MLLKGDKRVWTAIDGLWNICKMSSNVNSFYKPDYIACFKNISSLLNLDNMWKQKVG